MAEISKRHPGTGQWIPSDARPRYTRIAVALHWLVAALMVVNVGLALSVDSLPDPWVRPVIDVHKSIGLTVLGLLALRLLWRAGHPPPPAPARRATWERLGAAGAHVGLYVLVAALPITGWMHDSAWKGAAGHPLMVFGLFEVPRLPWIASVEPVAREVLHKRYGGWHEGLATVLYVLLAAHVLGALKHQFIDREAQFRRMWF